MNEMRKLMEAVQLDEYDRREPIYIEYRDPDGDFIATPEDITLLVMALIALQRLTI